MCTHFKSTQIFYMFLAYEIFSENLYNCETNKKRQFIYPEEQILKI